MSNCADVLDPVVLPLDPLKAEKFWKLVDAATRAKAAPAENADGTWPDALTFWWFLIEKNVSRCGTRGVRIELGGARSSHTFRDLEWTVRVLGGFVRPCHRTLLVVDVENDLDVVMKVTFSTQGRTVVVWA